MTDPAKQVAPPAAHRVGPDGRHWKSSLRWFLAEFVVVVAGVLVALAVSSWAQDRQDHKREQAYLRQLSADLKANERDLGEAVDFLRLRAEASARVLHRFWREDLVEDDTLREDLSVPRSTRRFRPVLGTAEALTSSGDLNLIRSDPLRAAILAYVEAMKTHLEDINRYDETYYRPAVAILYRGPDMYQFVKFKTSEDALRPRPNAFQRVPFPATMAGMLRDRDVYDGYNSLLVVHRNQSARYDEMRTQTVALRAQVEQAIER
jgi:hypothetical protein